MDARLLLLLVPCVTTSPHGVGDDVASWSCKVPQTSIYLLSGFLSSRVEPAHHLSSIPGSALQLAAAGGWM